MSTRSRRRPRRPPRLLHKPYVPSNAPKVRDEEVELIEGVGTRRTGAGAGGRYWHVRCRGDRAGRAYINYHETEAGSPRPSITVELNERSRGRGIGTIVFRRASELSGYDEVYASVRKSNTASRKALERAGFKPVKGWDGPSLSLVWERYGDNFKGVCDPGADHFAISIVFPRAAADDSNAAMDYLLQVFPDHEPTLVRERAGDWVFRLNWTSSIQSYVDPAASARATALWGLELGEIGGYHERYDWGGREVVFSLVHSWALLPPAYVIERSGRAPLWVVHIDDHTDLMPTLLEPLPGCRALHDHVFHKDVNLGDSKSVIAAVERGIVSKGNFLTAYLLGHRRCRIIHVGRNVVERECQLYEQMNRLVMGSAAVPQYRLVSDPPAPLQVATLQQRRTLPIDLPVEEGEGVWLDLDLDYFCNRYNGDSDRRGEVALPGEREEVMGRISVILAELRRALWLSKIEAVSIAVSPGFFPAEYWTEGMTVVRDGIQEILQG
jgi:Acetyltransferase (GNAT) domain